MKAFEAFKNKATQRKRVRTEADVSDKQLAASTTAQSAVVEKVAQQTAQPTQQSKSVQQRAVVRSTSAVCQSAVFLSEGSLCYCGNGVASVRCAACECAVYCSLACQLCRLQEHERHCSVSHAAYWRRNADAEERRCECGAVAQQLCGVCAQAVFCSDACALQHGLLHWSSHCRGPPPDARTPHVYAVVGCMDEQQRIKLLKTKMSKEAASALAGESTEPEASLPVPAFPREIVAAVLTQISAWPEAKQLQLAVDAEHAQHVISFRNIKRKCGASWQTMKDVAAEAQELRGAAHKEYAHAGAAHELAFFIADEMEARIKELFCAGCCECIAQVSQEKKVVTISPSAVTCGYCSDVRCSACGPCHCNLIMTYKKIAKSLSIW